MRLRCLLRVCVFPTLIPENRSSAVREEYLRRQLLGNGLVIRSYNSWLSVRCGSLLTTVLSRGLSSLHNFGWGSRENTASKGSSLFPVFLCVCMCIPLSLLGNVPLSRQRLGKHVPT
jgi:hypothetical protein